MGGSTITISSSQIHTQLEEDKFRELICHIVCGNQVVVRGAHALTVESFISIMATILPHGCVINKGFCPKYQDIPVNNFIGLYFLFVNVHNSTWGGGVIILRNNRETSERYYFLLSYILM